MILFTFLHQVLSLNELQIDKTIYLIEGEDYKVNLDSIFNEIYENTYNCVSQPKGFTLDASNLKLKSDQGTYLLSIKIIKIKNPQRYSGKGN